MRRAHAFTLIEFLVVIAIIAIFLMTLVPALLGARTASLRVSCINNMKQVDLALQNYLTTQGVLPSGCYGTDRPATSTQGGYQLSWILSLLPYMEQYGVYNAFDFRYGADHEANQTAVGVHIATLLCPSSGNRSWPFAPRGAIRGIDPGLGLTSYAGCHHDVESPIDEDNHGVMFLNSRVRAVDIADGLSHTIFVGEVPIKSALGWACGNRATLRNTGHPINGLDRVAVERAVIAGGSLPPGITARELDLDIESGTVKVAATYVGGFGSVHPGKGADFAFGDGSVRFLKQTIDQAVFRRLGHRADGEPIDEESY